MIRRLVVLPLALAVVPAFSGFVSAQVKIDAPVEHKPGEVVEVETAKGVKMKFCWIPAGEAQLGSPKAERLEVLELVGENREREWLAIEAEEKRGTFTTKGFWLGKYAVTQKEWETVMGVNPSYFSKQGHHKDEVAGMDTKRFPVEMVSWSDCQVFLEKLNQSVTLPAVMKNGRLALPNEDQWEYACRAGNRQAFYFGAKLNGAEANCNGSYRP